MPFDKVQEENCGDRPYAGNLHDDWEKCVDALDTEPNAASDRALRAMKCISLKRKAHGKYSHTVFLSEDLLCDGSDGDVSGPFERGRQRKKTKWSFPLGNLITETLLI